MTSHSDVPIQVNVYLNLPIVIFTQFTQNEHLLTQLLATEGTTLVEASPRDRIWGIGLGAQNPLAQNRETWRGTNYLGEILTRVRQQIIDEKKK